MIGPRWKKVWADLATHKSRTALVVAAMVVGIWGLGSVTVSYSVLTRQLEDNYKATNPASATLWVSGLDQSQALEVSGGHVASVLCKADGLQIIEDHLIVIMIFLTMMSLLVLAVGGLGLLSTMSINVLERTREIGVMRAIGAGTKTVIALVVAEGELVGLLSWIVALILAGPIHHAPFRARCVSL